MTSTDIAQLREAYEAAGQGHVFRFWEELGVEGRERLVEQLAAIDLKVVEELVAHRDSAEEARGTLDPATVLHLDEDPEGSSRDAARTRGEELLRAGRVGAFLVAGGQGSRLGYDGPKGCYPFGPISRRSLYELHALKIRRLREKYSAAIPWYVMTSAATHDRTVEFFRAHASFGLPPEDILFFEQGMLPAVDHEGRLVLERPDRLFMSPNGHGGAFAAFVAGGAAADARRRGIEHIFYFQVDNPLVRIADPLFVGLHDAAGSEMSLAVLQKTGPGEKIGVVALRGGRPTVVEYSDLPEELAERRDAAGDLVFGFGSIAIHLLGLEFMERIAAEVPLPYHVAWKSLPTIDAHGEPTQVEGCKFERFVFDALPHARRHLHLEVRREREFAPVKNPQGVDSVESARELVIAEHRRWLRAQGVDARAGVEISPLVALDEQDLETSVERWRGHHFLVDIRIERDANGRASLEERGNAGS